MDIIIHGKPIGDKLIIGGFLNGHIGRSNSIYEQMHGVWVWCQEWRRRDDIRHDIYYEVVIANTFFKKKDVHLNTLQKLIKLYSNRPFFYQEGGPTFVNIK